MKDDKRARLILDRWSSELSSKDRSRNSVMSNFEELFYDMWRANIPFDAAHSMLNEAVAKHFPSKSVAKFTFKRLKSHVDKDFREFLEDWKKSIHDKASQAFFSFYDVDGENQKEEKKFGNMSAQEYGKQRKYADSFPVIDTDELQKKLDDMIAEEENE